MRLAVSRLGSLPLKEGLKCLNPMLMSACRRRRSRDMFFKGTSSAYLRVHVMQHSFNQVVALFR